MDRGHEYTRAITLFVHKFNRFPASMEELENTNNLRFLRARYPDPMTGKTDWRILHAGPGGAITDSILNVKKPDGSGSSPGLVTIMQMFGSQATGDPEGVNLAARRRASDQPGAAGDPNNGGGTGGDANSQPGSSGYNGPVMVLPNGQIVPASTSGAPPSPFQNAGTAQTGTSQNNAGAPLPSGVAVQQGSQNTSNTPNTPALPSQFGPSNGAANLINQILTSPRPGGLNGLGGQGASAQGAPLTTGPAGTSVAGPSAATAPQQQVIGAGLAGVASKREQEGIKTYNDRTKYNEWEFVYDVTKDPTKVAQMPRTRGRAAAWRCRRSRAPSRRRTAPPRLRRSAPAARAGAPAHGAARTDRRRRQS